MPHVAIFFDCIQQRNIDALKVREFLDNFSDAISKVRKTYASEEVTTDEPNNKRRYSDYINPRNNRAAALEVCDVIVNNIKDRFQFSDHLSASKLFLISNFKDYAINFPANDLRDTIKAYPTLNGEKLKTELQVLYSREDLHRAAGAAALLQFFMKNNMSRTFSECVMLLKIIVTIPMTTVESERCFSTLNRIKTFLRNSMVNERLNALAVLSLEKKVIRDIPEFNKKVIQEFATAKERRVYLIYKH